MNSDTTRQKIEDLIQIFTEGQQQLEQIEKREALCQTEEQRIRELERTVDTKAALVRADQARVAEEKLATKKLNEEIVKKQQQHLKEKEELVVMQVETDKKLIALKEDEVLAKKHTVELNRLLEKAKQFEFEKSLIEKEKTVDRQRKELLDAREDRIRRREEQLQILSDA